MSTSLKTVIDAELNGYSRTYEFRKNPNQVTLNGYWFDYSMSPGNPVPQYYIGPQNTAVQMKQSTDGGLFHGSDVAPYSKYLRQITIRSTGWTATGFANLLDYLMFYSFIDQSITDEQFMINNVTLPRYQSGEGVKVMAISVAGGNGGQYFTIKYTNSKGVSNRVSKPTIQYGPLPNGTVMHTGVSLNGIGGTYIDLQDGDTGVRSIESVTMLGPDVGLFALVLVKPLASIQIKESTNVYEKDFLLLNGILPKIEDDAFLGLTVLLLGSVASSSILGSMKTVWF